MGFRRFTDRQGHRWEVKPRSRYEWHFQPLPGNAQDRRVGTAPGYEKDPFELSEQELQRICDGAESVRQKADRPSPFKQDRPSLFKDD
jgi:hypothetical protein